MSSKVKNRTWYENFKRLLAFKEDHGHSNVPQRYKQDKQLGRWANNQRTKYNNNSISAEHCQLLDSIGFVWKCKSTRSWNESFRLLLAFKAEHGHCNVPQSYEQDKQLGLWVMNQRTNNNNKSISAERQARLNSINFCWRLRGRSPGAASEDEETCGNKTCGNTSEDDETMDAPEDESLDYEILKFDVNNDVNTIGNIKWKEQPTFPTGVLHKAIKHVKEVIICPTESQHKKEVKISHELQQTPSGHSVVESSISMDSKHMLSKVATLCEITDEQAQCITHQIFLDLIAALERSSNKALHETFIRMPNYLRVELKPEYFDDEGLLSSISKRVYLMQVLPLLNVYRRKRSFTGLHGDHRDGNYRTVVKMGLAGFSMVTSVPGQQCSNLEEKMVYEIKPDHKIKMMAGTRTSLNKNERGGNNILHQGGNNSGTLACSFIFDTKATATATAPTTGETMPMFIDIIMEESLRFLKANPNIQPPSQREIKRAERVLFDNFEKVREWREWKNPPDPVPPAPPPFPPKPIPIPIPTPKPLKPLPIPLPVPVPRPSPPPDSSSWLRQMRLAIPGPLAPPSSPPPSPRPPRPSPESLSLSDGLSDSESESSSNWLHEMKCLIEGCS